MRLRVPRSQGFPEQWVGFLPNRRESFGDRTCRPWAEARKQVLVLHREAWRSARDVTRLSEATGGCAATVYQFADGSVAYACLDFQDGCFCF